MRKYKKEYPKVNRDSEYIEINLLPYEKEAKRVKTELILDLDHFGSVTGLEIINLKLEIGEGCLDCIQRVIKTERDNITYSYDEECDAFYLRLSSKPSLDQKVIEGLLVLNESDEIVGIRIYLLD